MPGQYGGKYHIVWKLYMCTCRDGYTGNKVLNKSTDIYVGQKLLFKRSILESHLEMTAIRSLL